jgi:multidrug efflux pump subunit AcrA (membrane-fusion protein)
MKRSSGTKKTATVIVAVMLLAATALLLFSAGRESPQPLGRVERKDLLQRVTIAGTIVPRRRTLVTAPYNGYVKEVFVKVGDQVRPGQPLVSVTQSLQSQEPVFPLRAPYAGTVVHVNKQEGENVKEGDSNEYLMRIDDMTKYYVEASAPEIDRVKLKLNQEAVIKASAILDKSYKGVITELTLAPRQGQGRSQQEYPVRIEVSDKDDILGPGMSVVVDIITARRENVLTLRHEFVHRDENGFYFVIHANGERRPIQVGMQNEESFEILDGIAEGQQVRQIDFASLATGG